MPVRLPRSRNRGARENWLCIIYSNGIHPDQSKLPGGFGDSIARTRARTDEPRRWAG
jgi:hypothetical protein